MATKHEYLAARVLPAELLGHVIIYIDEGLCQSSIPFVTSRSANHRVTGTQVLSLLRGLVANRYHAVASEDGSGYAFVPNAHILALLASTSVHPTMTTRAAPENEDVSKESLSLLALINNAIGPKNAGLQQAFLFTQQAGLGGRRKQNRLRRSILEREDDSQSPGEHSADEREAFVKGSLGHDDGLFSKAQDFWHLLGWALNCAAKHPQRWTVWKQWLDFHLDVLEDDWALRVDQWLSTNDESDHERMILRESLIMQYLKGAEGREGRTSRHRILRSIFAHAAKTDVHEFVAVFRNELKGRKVREDVFSQRKRKRIDLDENDWGDYYDDDVEEEVEIKNEDGTRRRVSARKFNDALENNTSIIEDDEERRSHVEVWGGLEALRVRQRVLVLVSPSHSTVTMRIPWLMNSTAFRSSTLPARRFHSSG